MTHFPTTAQNIFSNIDALTTKLHMQEKILLDEIFQTNHFQAKSRWEIHIATEDARTGMINYQ